MNKKFFGPMGLILVVALLTGCNYKHYTRPLEEVCIDGVIYFARVDDAGRIQSITVAHSPDGTVKTCHGTTVLVKRLAQ